MIAALSESEIGRAFVAHLDHPQASWSDFGLHTTVNPHAPVTAALRCKGGEIELMIRPDTPDAHLGAVLRVLLADSGLFGRRGGDPPGDWAVLAADDDGTLHGIGDYEDGDG